MTAPSDAEKRAVEAAKLLGPCPFCGPQTDAEDKPRVSLGETSIGVFCPSCNTWYEAQKPPSDKYVAALIERWNKPLGVVAAERAAYDRAIEAIQRAKRAYRACMDDVADRREAWHHAEHELDEFLATECGRSTDAQRGIDDFALVLRWLDAHVARRVVRKTNEIAEFCHGATSVAECERLPTGEPRLNEAARTALLRALKSTPTQPAEKETG